MTSYTIYRESLFERKWTILRKTDSLFSDTIGSFVSREDAINLAITDAMDKDEPFKLHCEGK